MWVSRLLLPGINLYVAVQVNIAVKSLKVAYSGITYGFCYFCLVYLFG